MSTSAPAEPSLKGLNGRLMVPASWAVAVGIALSASYCALTIDFSQSSALAFVVVSALVGAFTTLIGLTVGQRRVLTLRQVSAGSVRPTPQVLEAAVKEAVARPVAAFWLVVFGFCIASPLTAAAWWAVARPLVSSALRAGLTGLAMAPFSATLAYVVMLPRARRALERLVSAGLPVHRAYDVLPPQPLLRRQLFTFAAISVATPLALMTDSMLLRLSALSRGVPAPFEMQSAIGFFVMLVLVVLLTAVLLARVLTQPIIALARHAERLASGQFAQAHLVPSEYELWSVARSFATVELRLVEATKQLRETASGIATTTTALVGGGARRDARLDEQSAALMATAASTQGLATSAQRIADNAQNVSSLAKQTLLVARQGTVSADAFAAVMVQVRTANQAIADSVVKLTKRVQQVGTVVEFIDGIADKTDLLALNAELTGHKAGEVGSGFSVVAAEMRGLAESVMTSTREIAALITDIRDSTNGAVMATEAGVKATEVGTGLAQHVRDGLFDIVMFANQSSEAIAAISVATLQQQLGTTELAQVMSHLARSTEAGADASKHMADTTLELKRLATELDETVASMSRRAAS